MICLTPVNALRALRVRRSDGYRRISHFAPSHQNTARIHPPLPGSLPGTDHSRVAFAQASATIPSPCPPVSSSAPVLGPDHDDGIPRAPASPRIRSGVRAGRGSTRGVRRVRVTPRRDREHEARAGANCPLLQEVLREAAAADSPFEDFPLKTMLNIPCLKASETARRTRMQQIRTKIATLSGGSYKWKRFTRLQLQGGTKRPREKAERKRLRPKGPDSGARLGIRFSRQEAKNFEGLHFVATFLTL